MKITEILVESQNRPIIIVDVQPEYEKYIGYKLQDLAKRLMSFLNNHTGTILYFFNGDGFSQDSLNDVKRYCVDRGLDPDKIHDIQFREKTYAFFRAWMDQGVDKNKIIKVIRYMVMKRVNDSRELPESELSELLGPSTWGDWVNDDPLVIPDISLAELKRLSGAYLAGGGRHECLAEIQLLMNAFNIKYKLLQEFIY